MPLRYIAQQHIDMAIQPLRTQPAGHRRVTEAPRP